jgi:L-alanine-DL-glutamate epimerase-like enolase superfamily enzyme
VASIITGESLAVQVCEALGLDPGTVVRLIIDLDCRDPGPIPVYVQMCGTKEMLEIDWEAALKGAKVIKCKRVAHDHTSDGEI